jgi:hypothetical protein
MTAAELATCHVPEDLASPIPVGGYVMACVEFYEWLFGVSSHQLLRSLLKFYNFKLQHLTPSRILQMATFVTLCEAYIVIEPHFFWVRLQQGSGTKVAA